MPRLELEVETSLPPDKVRNALLDFSDRRPAIWPNLDPSFYEVYEVGETTAVVKEGTKLPGMSIWARERYDWSQPGVVSWTVEESNFCTSGSRVITTLRAREGGGTRMHVDWERVGTTLRGRLLVRMMVLTKGKAIEASLGKTFRRLEQEL